MDTEQTIAVISTPPGNGAIALIRLSGKESFSIASKIFRSRGKKVNISEMASHSVHFGEITDGDEILDDVLLSVFKSPNSYTGEDMVEISCHGSLFIQQKLLQLVVNAGARIAGPGEFTMRAFLNRRMDLAQAEAVAELIATRTSAMHRIAINQMRGGFSNEIKKLREELVQFASLVELELDFSEEDVSFASRENLLNTIRKIREFIGKLADSFYSGNAIKNGIPVAIAGKPNVGKSTLLNALLHEEKAIVSEIPGTTRDIIEDELNVGGVIFRLMDTAGLRKAQDAIEATGVKKTMEKIKASAIILYVFDVHELTCNELGSILKELNRKTGDEVVKIIPVGNKIDKKGKTFARIKFAPLRDVIFISAKKKQGMDEITSKLLETIHYKELHNEDTVVANSRHWEALVKADESLTMVEDGIKKKQSGEFIAADIRNALFHMGLITGEITTDELLGSIFSKFCIGK